MVYRQNNVCLN